jgi:hypothetical protein
MSQRRRVEVSRSPDHDLRVWGSPSAGLCRRLGVARPNSSAAPGWTSRRKGRSFEDPRDRHGALALEDRAGASALEPHAMRRGRCGIGTPPHRMRHAAECAAERVTGCAMQPRAPIAGPAAFLGCPRPLRMGPRLLPNVGASLRRTVRRLSRTGRGALRNVPVVGLRILIPCRRSRARTAVLGRGGMSTPASTGTDGRLGRLLACCWSDDGAPSGTALGQFGRRQRAADVGPTTLRGRGASNRAMV